MPFFKHQATGKYGECQLTQKIGAEINLCTESQSLVSSSISNA